MDSLNVPGVAKQYFTLFAAERSIIGVEAPAGDTESGGIVWYGEILRHAHASCQRSAEATNIGQMTSAEGEGK